MRQCGLNARILLYSHRACGCQRKDCLAECRTWTTRIARTESANRAGDVELRRKSPEDGQDWGVEISDAARGCTQRVQPSDTSGSQSEHQLRYIRGDQFEDWKSKVARSNSFPVLSKLRIYSNWSAGTDHTVTQRI